MICEVISINNTFKENITHICELCEREVKEITKHHLIPKEKGGKEFKTAHMCKTCHRQVHALFNNRELSARLFTIKRLKSHPSIQRYLKFLYTVPANKEINIKKRRKKIR